MADLLEENSELLEYYNSAGFFKGLADRKSIHNNGLWHKGVHVWLFNSKGQLFLKKRSKYKEMHPLHWEDVGEHLKPNEDFRSAALRGLKEELGVEEEKIKEVYKVSSQRMEFGNDREFIELWFCIYDGPIIESKESFSGRFFEKEEIKEMIRKRSLITPWFKELFYWCLKEDIWIKQKTL
ncbi:MAG: NUDIX domain-containing protein [Candidatus Diapherotrites archaeon]|nr:NUDIX domain-containing protein [Candidatus Diapherotrites archaeon]